MVIKIISTSSKKVDAIYVDHNIHTDEIINPNIPLVYI